MDISAASEEEFLAVGEENNDEDEEEDEGRERETICVEYPGVVVNENVALDTLGGLETIAKRFDEKNRRLELRFRPKDTFCKPVCGERVDEPSFLMKVRRYRRKNPNEPGGYEYKCEAEVIGEPVETSFKFVNLADFQYLPMVRKKSEENRTETEDDHIAGRQLCDYDSIYDEVYFNERLPDVAWLNDGENAPLFLPPATFSRMDVPSENILRKETASDNTPYNIIGRTRSRRSHHAIFLTYDMSDVPSKPRDVALKQLKLKFINDEDMAPLNAKFREQPIWTKNAIIALTGISAEKLKFMLPTVAYYFTNGPWRNQWVRFGFDPRAEVSAAAYQTMDFRVPRKGLLRDKVKAKRSYANYLLPYKAVNTARPKTAVIRSDTLTLREAKKEVHESESSSNITEEKMDEINEAKELQTDRYIFRPNRIPPYRQMFYQYKDLLIEEAKYVVDQLTSGGGGMAKSCTEKNGWFPPGTDRKLRDAMNRAVDKMMEDEKNLGKSNETASSLNDSNNLQTFEAVEEEEDDLDDDDVINSSDEDP